MPCSSSIRSVQGNLIPVAGGGESPEQFLGSFGRGDARIRRSAHLRTTEFEPAPFRVGAFLRQRCDRARPARDHFLEEVLHDTVRRLGRCACDPACTALSALPSPESDLLLVNQTGPTRGPNRRTCNVAVPLNGKWALSRPIIGVPARDAPSPRPLINPRVPLIGSMKECRHVQRSESLAAGHIPRMMPCTWTPGNRSRAERSALAARAREIAGAVCLAAALCIATDARAASKGVPDERTGAAIAVYAQTLIGRPYRAGGSAPEQGFDCSGFVQHVFRTAGDIDLPRRARDMASRGRKVGSRQLRPGDLVFYNTLGAPFSHVGIYVGDGLFAHAPSSGGSVRIVAMNHDYWLRRYSGARRLLQPAAVLDDPAGLRTAQAATVPATVTPKNPGVRKKTQRAQHRGPARSRPARHRPVGA